MIIEVEIYKVIRKLTPEGVSQRQIAKKLGISRQTVKKNGDGDTVPGNRKEYERPASVVTPDILAFIESCFEADALENLPKQKHTAKRIYERLVTEKEFKGAESTIRTAVRSLRSAQTVPSQAMTACPMLLVKLFRLTGAWLLYTLRGKKQRSMSFVPGSVIAAISLLLPTRLPTRNPFWKPSNSPLSTLAESLEE